MVSKGTLHFKFVPKNKWKLSQMKKDEIEEESYLNYTAIIKHAVCFLVCLFLS